MSRRHRFIGQTDKRSRPIYVLLLKMLEYLGRFKRIIAVGAVIVLIATIFQGELILFLPLAALSQESSS
jgi:hypothetical protein